MEFVYKGLKGKLVRRTATDEDVDSQLELLRSHSPKITRITGRPAEVGDELILDYAGSVDGIPFDGGSAEQQPLTLGSHTFIPGFEEQLVGAEIGVPVTVKVTFPEAYPAEQLAGKAADFQCLVHEIRKSEERTLDDGFAKEVADCETLAELREKLRASLQSYLDEQAEQELQTELINRAAETLEFEPTEEQLDRAVQEQLDALTARLQSQGLDLGMYCTFTRQTEEQVKQSLLPEAEKMLRFMNTVGKIGGLENIVPTDEELTEAFMQIAKENQLTEAQMQEINDDREYINAITSGVLVRKVMRFVRNHAEIEE